MKQRRVEETASQTMPAIVELPPGVVVATHREAPRTGFPAAQALVFGLVALGHLAVVLFIRTFGWDDGAITLAFAKTFAATGRIALTPASVVVEGSSSPLWFLLMAGVYELAQPGFEAFIALSQIAAGLCCALSALIFFRLLRPALGVPAAAVLSPAVFLSAPFLNETMNGMEMALLACLVLLVLRALQAPGTRPVVLVVLGAAMAAVRLEGVAYVLGAAGLLWLLQPAARRAALLLAGGALLGAGLLELARLAVFGEWLPNTVLAKRWAPYRPSLGDERWAARWEALQEPFLAYRWALVPLAAAVLFLRPARQALVAGLRRQPAWLFAAGFWLCVWGANTVIGRNWGYPSRMQLSVLALPFLLLPWALAAAGPRRWVFPAVALAPLALFGSLPQLQWDHVRYAREAWAGRPPTGGITPDNYRNTGLAMDTLRQRLGLPVLRVLVPDVGGSALCCERLEIVDSALLTDPTLAREGYARFGSRLAERRPDVIETHGLWSGVTGIYGVPFFREQYQPVVLNGTWLWLRRDLASKLPPPVPAPADAARLRYRGDAIDEAFIAAHPQPVIVLD